ncbi:Hypothetical predicted protein [Octopus vulgaris]|uniref:Uncharacterized protein n=1 Tax=Octopus vulgaris TaxID=6645 RepID=A0AA36FJC9_OCTVU|nr:Hypothetical predicted protein [Octopus vulgaris]
MLIFSLTAMMAFPHLRCRRYLDILPVIDTDIVGRYRHHKYNCYIPIDTIDISILMDFTIHFPKVIKGISNTNAPSEKHNGLSTVKQSFSKFQARKIWLPVCLGLRFFENDNELSHSERDYHKMAHTYKQFRDIKSGNQSVFQQLRSHDRHTKLRPYWGICLLAY